MHTGTNEQLDAIHSMMASGHHSVRIERHTLILWGLGIAFLITVTGYIFTLESFPVIWQRITATHFFIVTVLISIGIWDFRLTLRARRIRDETLSFVQMQLTKVWWLLIVFLVMVNLGTNIFGGEPIFLGILLGMIGLALYIQGLFSQQMLSWIGIMMIIMGILMVVLGVPFPMQEWLAVGVFGIGFPFLALILDKTETRHSLRRRFIAANVWLILVIAPSVLVYQWEIRNVNPAVTEIGLSHYRAQTISPIDTQVVRIPSGFTVPIQLELIGDLIVDTKAISIPFKLSRSVDIAVKDNKPDGRFRVSEGEWKKHVYSLNARVTELRSTMEPTQGPKIYLKVKIVAD